MEMLPFAIFSGFVLLSVACAYGLEKIANAVQNKENQ